MAENVLMIALSPTMEEGTILNWSAKEGDTISTGDVLCEVETDKASMEYESAQEGTLLKIIKGEGSPARVGDVIAIIGEEGEDVSDLVAEAEAAPAAAPEPKAEEPKKETAPASEAAKEAAPKPAAPKASTPAPSVSPSSDDRIKASPLARKIAASRGINLGMVKGTGPAGRIVKEDVENFKAPLAPVEGVAVGGSSGNSFGSPLVDETVPVSRMRQTIAKRLAESKFGAPHFYLTLSVAMDGMVDFRKKANARAKEKLGLNPFFMKFAAEAIKRHRELNSSWLGDSIQFHGSIDIGLAVALPTGLITPVVRDCGNKGIAQIDAELKVLIDKAKNGGLAPDEYNGATFTISNLGSFGIEEFTAIINPPGSAILALGATVKTPVVNDNDELEIKNIMKMTLSCDHRTIDGAIGAAFMSDMKKMMEDPFQLLM
ncbi:pyruvate dehydrogenase complex dihydrolipoamide acetyltransferase [Spirochaeta cellobiosiphila]|uniref:pyruvate dehydrogenase complex dihydrolipoamide acetyltransferase n=1 Tax=Spirochaeta cellobiosiphila TaxID=504483 RepID=UPI00042522F6|nr:pyruvate dehydrogenase complex dihydrolipoamide acetyltransferase [Spirochaeta cellobiosiphila]